MKTRFRKLWDTLRSNYWFLPSAMMAISVVVWIGTSTIDQILTARDKGAIAWLYVDTIDSMRTLLLTIEGTIIGIVGVVFSVMMVPLSIAASQFGPRLLRTFLRDTGTQITLGIFTSTFIYCMLVLLQLRGVPEKHLPQISATVGLLFGIISFATLIFFINHVAVSIQVSVLVAKVSRELHTAIDHDLPDHPGNAVPSPDPTNAVVLDSTKANYVVHARASGYVHMRDHEGLLSLAEKNNLVLHLVTQPGDFVIKGTPLAIVWPETAVSEKMDAAINAAFILGKQRTLIQDVTFGINELVEVAIRALSPAINDPFTAMTCLDWLGSALCIICVRNFPVTRVCDKEGHLRLIRDVVTFTGMADAAFNQIREYGRNSRAVTLRLMETIAVVARCARTEEQRKALLGHAELVERGCHIGLPEEADRQPVIATYHKITDLLGKGAYNELTL